MYDAVVLQGKLGRSSVWNFNNGEPPLRKSNTASSADQADPPHPSSPKRQKKAGSTKTAKKKVYSAEASKTASPVNDISLGEGLTEHDGTATPSRKFKVTKSRPLPPSLMPKSHQPQSAVETPRRRPSSLFLPSSGIFSQLDAIEEADEDEVLTRPKSNGKNGDDHGGASGGSSGNLTSYQDLQAEETFPPVKAGTRRPPLHKPIAKQSAQFTPASKITTVPIDNGESLRSTGIQLKLNR